MAVSGAALALGACGRTVPAAGDLSEGELHAWLRYVDGDQAGSGDAQGILASLKANRFTAAVDPTIQPQSDFDPDVDP
jgi:hypothetical protein